MTRILIVPSPSLSPLSTGEPIPTPGRWRCFRCGHTRLRDVFEPCGECPSRLSTWAGPFPFTVAVWQECPTCEGSGQVELCPMMTDECPVCEGHGGVVVATVEVTGPSHHAGDCAHDAPGEVHGFPQGRVREVERRYCHPDALPDCWHTPTGQVSRLDVPIPMERPHAQVAVQRIEDPEPSTIDGVPEPWWWADIDLEVPA